MVQIVCSLNKKHSSFKHIYKYNANYMQEHWQRFFAGNALIPTLLLNIGFLPKWFTWSDDSPVSGILCCNPNERESVTTTKLTVQITNNTAAYIYSYTNSVCASTTLTISLCIYCNSLVAVRGTWVASSCVDLTLESTESKKNLKLGKFEFTIYLPVMEETGVTTGACFFLNGLSFPKKWMG